MQKLSLVSIFPNWLNNSNFSTRVMMTQCGHRTRDRMECCSTCPAERKWNRTTVHIHKLEKLARRVLKLEKQAKI